MNFFKGSIPTFYILPGTVTLSHVQQNRQNSPPLLLIKNNTFPPLFAGAAREERKNSYDEL
jgi:hypothetical protein